VGHIQPRSSWSSLLAIWNDVIRDVDDFGLQLTSVPDKDEVAFGRQLATQFERTNVIDAEATRYVTQVASALIPHTSRRTLPWDLHVIGRTEPNAFALPGGEIFVTQGLLSFAQSEAELAFVIAHEMAHIDLRHCVRRYQYQLKLQSISLGALGTLTDLARVPFEISYSKYQEMEADAEAVRIVSDTGYDPHAGVALMLRMADAEHSLAKAARTPGGELLSSSAEALREYVRSHPGSADRAELISQQLRTEQSELANRKLAVGEENLRRRVPVDLKHPAP